MGHGWQWAKGIPVNPEATTEQYQLENLNFFNFTLTAADILYLDHFDQEPSN